MSKLDHIFRGSQSVIDETTNQGRYRYRDFWYLHFSTETETESYQTLGFDTKTEIETLQV